MLLFSELFILNYFHLVKENSLQREILTETEMNCPMTFLLYSNVTPLRGIIFGGYIYMIILVHANKFPKRAVKEGRYSTSASSLNDLYRIPALPQVFFIVAVAKMGKGIACHKVGLSSDLWSNDHNIVFLSLKYYFLFS